MQITDNFKDNLAQLPGVTHLDSIVITGPGGAAVATIENQPGQQGSLAVYHFLAHAVGSVIDKRFAAQALALYAEHTADARANPGKHPNIDRLLEIEAGGAALALTLVPQRAAQQA